MDLNSFAHRLYNDFPIKLKPGMHSESSMSCTMSKHVNTIILARASARKYAPVKTAVICTNKV